jgi:hypothetical protein
MKTDINWHDLNEDRSIFLKVNWYRQILVETTESFKTDWAHNVDSYDHQLLEGLSKPLTE